MGLCSLYGTFFSKPCNALVKYRQSSSGELVKVIGGARSKNTQRATETEKEIMCIEESSEEF